MSDVKATKNVPVIMPQDLWGRIEAEAQSRGVTTDAVIVPCLEACICASVSLSSLISEEDIEAFLSALPSWSADAQLHPFQTDRYRKDDKPIRLGLQYSAGSQRMLQSLTGPGSLALDEDTAPSIKIPPSLQQGGDDA